MSIGGAQGHRIACPDGRFGRIEHEIADITAAINFAAGVAAKASLASGLRERLTALFACDAYEESNVNCRACRAFASLREKTALLVEATAGLAHRAPDAASGGRHA